MSKQAKCPNCNKRHRVTVETFKLYGSEYHCDSCAIIPITIGLPLKPLSSTEEGREENISNAHGRALDHITAKHITQEKST